jgi:hypothetical protein
MFGPNMTIFGQIVGLIRILGKDDLTSPLYVKKGTDSKKEVLPVLLLRAKCEVMKKLS